MVEGSGMGGQMEVIEFNPSYLKNCSPTLESNYQRRACGGKIRCYFQLSPWCSMISPLLDRFVK